MRLSQLLYFEAAGRLESVTKAAEELHVSQPSISMSIKELESELGVALFQRVNKRLYLTEEGRYFLSELSQILRQLDRLTKEMKEAARLLQFELAAQLRDEIQRLERGEDPTADDTSERKAAAKTRKGRRKYKN